MKRLRIFFNYLLPVAGILLFASCKDKEPSVTPLPPIAADSSSFSVLIGNTYFVSDTARFNINEQSLQLLSGCNSYSQTFLININGTVEGIYPVNTKNTITYLYKISATESKTYTAHKGRISLSDASFNKRITGTFYGTLQNVADPGDTLSITLGAFSIIP